MMEKDRETPSAEKKRVFLFFTLYSAIGTAFGAAGAYLFYLKVGCSSGTCAITSNPWLSAIWGAVMGYLLGDIFSTRKTKDKQE
jgi:hypothetical protein